MTFPIPTPLTRDFYNVHSLAFSYLLDPQKTLHLHQFLLSPFPWATKYLPYLDCFSSSPDIHPSNFNGTLNSKPKDTPSLEHYTKITQWLFEWASEFSIGTPPFLFVLSLFPTLLAIITHSRFGIESVPKNITPEKLRILMDPNIPLPKIPNSNVEKYSLLVLSIVSAIYSQIRIHPPWRINLFFQLHPKSLINLYQHRNLFSKDVTSPQAFHNRKGTGIWGQFPWPYGIPFLEEAPVNGAPPAEIFQQPDINLKSIYHEPYTLVNEMHDLIRTFRKRAKEEKKRLIKSNLVEDVDFLGIAKASAKSARHRKNLIYHQSSYPYVKEITNDLDFSHLLSPDAETVTLDINVPPWVCPVPLLGPPKDLYSTKSPAARPLSQTLQPATTVADGSGSARSLGSVISSRSSISAFSADIAVKRYTGKRRASVSFGDHPIYTDDALDQDILPSTISDILIAAETSGGIVEPWFPLNFSFLDKINSQNYSNDDQLSNDSSQESSISTSSDSLPQLIAISKDNMIASSNIKSAHVWNSILSSTIRAFGSLSQRFPLMASHLWFVRVLALLLQDINLFSSSFYTNLLPLMSFYLDGQFSLNTHSSMLLMASTFDPEYSIWVPKTSQPISSNLIDSVKTSNSKLIPVLKTESTNILSLLRLTAREHGFLAPLIGFRSLASLSK